MHRGEGGEWKGALRFESPREGLGGVWGDGEMWRKFESRAGSRLSRGRIGRGSSRAGQEGCRFRGGRGAGRLSSLPAPRLWLPP